MSRSVPYDDGLQIAHHREHDLEAVREGLEVHKPQPQSHAYQAVNDEKPLEQRPTKLRICGLSRTIFWLCVVILFLIIAVAAVGGAVGGTRNSSKSSSASDVQSSSSSSTLAPSRTATETPSSATSIVFPSGTSSAAAVCAGNGTMYTASTGSTFLRLCDTDTRLGPDFTNSTTAVIYTVNVNSMEGCLDACALWNVEGLTWAGDGNCQAATWMSEGSSKGTCWMKNATALWNGTHGKYVTNSPDTQTGNLLIR